jgi:hypothetical protein
VIVQEIKAVCAHSHPQQSNLQLATLSADKGPTVAQFGVRSPLQLA